MKHHRPKPAARRHPLQLLRLQEAMVRQWALRFPRRRQPAGIVVLAPGLSDRERAYEAAPVFTPTATASQKRSSVLSQLAMVSDDFAQY